MDITEQTLDATLQSNGQLILTQTPQLPPGPVQVTIRVAASEKPHRGLANVVAGIAKDQRARGYPGRSAEEIRAEDDAHQADDSERDQELDSA